MAAPALRAFLGRIAGSLAVPVLAIFTALMISGVIIWVSTGDPSKAFGPKGAFVGLFTPKPHFYARLGFQKDIGMHIAL